MRGPSMAMGERGDVESDVEPVRQTKERIERMNKIIALFFQQGEKETKVQETSRTIRARLRAWQEGPRRSKGWTCWFFEPPRK